MVLARLAASVSVSLGSEPTSTKTTLISNRWILNSAWSRLYASLTTASFDDWAHEDNPLCPTGVGKKQSDRLSSHAQQN